MKVKTVKIPLYHGYIHIGIKRKLDCSGYVQRDKKSCIYWLVLKRSAISHGLIAHEIVHLVNMIFVDRRIKFEPNNDEAQAYFTEWLATAVYKKLKKFKLPY